MASAGCRPTGSGIERPDLFAPFGGSGARVSPCGPHVLAYSTVECPDDPWRRLARMTVPWDEADIEDCRGNDNFGSGHADARADLNVRS